VNDALFGAYPTQLAVAGHPVPERRRIGCELFDRLAADQIRQRFDRRDTQLVAAADGEREAVALESAGVIGLEDGVRG
jgi:hypothetical protein